MNGDTGKLSTGTVYPTSSPEPILGVTPLGITNNNNNNNMTTTTTSVSLTAANSSTITNQSQTQNSTDFPTMNGAEGGSDYSDTPNNTNENNGRVTTTPDGNAIPIDQLKQLLSAQLDYYFSR